jgi:hypothetical protein
LIPGFLVGGFGSGMVNPPLASTAVGVVTPERSGMASGVNTTFRQIGIATSIAAFGSIFTSSLRHHLASALARVPSLAGHESQVVSAVQQGEANSLFRSVPAAVRGELAGAVHSSFAGALNDLLIVSGSVALVGAVCSLLLIRSKDFVAARPVSGPSPAAD